MIKVTVDMIDFIGGTLSNSLLIIVEEPIQSNKG
jgi:hypothetical protein